MLKKNKLILLSITFSILVVFGISESFAQEIPLEPNRQENTYKTWNVNGILDIQVRDAKDRGKALNGTHKLEYKCKKDSNILSRNIQITDGVSERLRDICARIIAEVIDIGEKKILLREGAGTNGFTVRKEGNSAYLLTNNVINPNTNKPLEGSKQIRLSVYSDYEISGLFAIHRGGNSRSRLSRKFLALIEADDLERRVYELQSTKIILDTSEMGNPTDDSSNGKTKSDSTNNSPTTNKTKDSSSQNKRGSTISDDASVNPTRADSSVSKQSKSNSNAKSSNENENLANNGRETRNVQLIKNARKNGYKTWKKDGVSYFQANNVVDPLTKKLVEGLQDLSYRCGSGNTLTRIKLKLSRGNTQRVAVACSLIKEPKIILADEPYQN